MRIVIVTLLAASAAFGQPASAQALERTFHLDHPPPAAYFQEIAITLRSVARIRTVATDPSSATVSVSGTSGDIAMAEWIIQALDAEAPRKPDFAVHEYPVAGAK